MPKLWKAHYYDGTMKMIKAETRYAAKIAASNYRQDLNVKYGRNFDSRVIYVEELCERLFVVKC